MKLIFNLLLAISCFILISCDGNEEYEPSGNDVYYVKYTAGFRSNFGKSQGTMSYKKGDGSSTSIKGYSPSVIVGPVKKHFKCYMNASMGSGIASGSIYVSKGADNYVLRASGSNRNSVSLEHTIDY